MWRLRRGVGAEGGKRGGRRGRGSRGGGGEEEEEIFELVFTVGPAKLPVALLPSAQLVILLPPLLNAPSTSSYFCFQLAATDLRTSSKHAMFLNLLFKSLRIDKNLERIGSFLKRLLQGDTCLEETEHEKQIGKEKKDVDTDYHDGDGGGGGGGGGGDDDDDDGDRVVV
eukprot:762949-Hanusia_phi.AAC.7